MGKEARAKEQEISRAVHRIANGPLVESLVKRPAGEVPEGKPLTVRELVDAEIREVQTFGAVNRALGGHQWRERFQTSDAELIEYLHRTEREIAARLAKLEILTVAHAATSARLTVAEQTFRELGREALYDQRLKDAGLALEVE